jgi:hypothetical protein
MAALRRGALAGLAATRTRREGEGGEAGEGLGVEVAVGDHDRRQRPGSESVDEGLGSGIEGGAVGDGGEEAPSGASTAT